MNSTSASNAFQEKVRQYWVLSSIWNRRATPTLMSPMQVMNTIGGLIDELSGLADKNLGQRLDSYVCALLDNVIQNRRCRKSKPINNVIRLRQVHVTYADGTEDRISEVHERHYEALMRSSN